MKHFENCENKEKDGIKGKTDLQQNTVFIEDSLRSLLRIWNYNVENDSKFEKVSKAENNKTEYCNGNRDYKENRMLNYDFCNNSNDDKNEDDYTKKRCSNDMNNINNSKNNNNSIKTNASTGGNHVRDLAFIQAAEIILNQIQNLEIMFHENKQKSGFSNYGNCGNHGFSSCDFNCNVESINCNMKSETMNEIDQNAHVNKKDKEEILDMNKIKEHISYNLIPSSIFSRPVKFRVLIERVLQKILTGMLSYHCKIACMCLAMIDKREILMKYFVTITDDNCDNSDNENNFNEYSGESVEYESKKDRIIDRISDKLSDWKQTQLDKLVEVLRKNRNHWHPSVKSASGQLFDKLLNYLE